MRGRPRGRRPVARALVLALAAQLAVGVGCRSSVAVSPGELSAPVESTTVGPGDLFIMEIVGEKDLPKEYQVASDGTVDLPYLPRLTVEGLEPQEIAALVRQELVAAQILSAPTVIVQVKEYNSKRISVLGQVNDPGSFPLTPGLTLIQVLSQAGGFNSIANRDRVTITRLTSDGPKTYVLSVGAITDGRAGDIPLQAGDSIYVPERVF